MNNSPLEFLAKKYENVVKYDSAGEVSGIFVKFPKMKSSDLVAGLPTHTHPAFIINGVEKDYILLGKYKGGDNGVSGGAILSLPNINPIRSLGADQCLSRMKLAGSDITGMTVADYGFIKLLAQKNGKTDIAISEFERALAYDENATTVYKDLALVYLQNGDTKKALANTKELQKKEFDNVDTQMFAGSLFLSLNDTEGARKCWERALEIDPSNEVATVYLAAYYSSDNKLEESVKYWTKYLEQQPESSEGYFQLGLAQERMGLLDKALNSYKKVTKLKPEAQEAYLARARVYENKKEFKLAIDEYKEYAKLFTGNPAILIYLGKCYYEEKNYEQAEEILLRAKEYVPNNITLNYLLGIVYEKQLKLDDAIDTFEFIVKHEPTAANYTRLGYFYSLKRDYKTAEKRFNKALNIEPLNSEILYLAALNCLDYEKYDEARKKLEKSIYLKPDFNEGKFFLAVTYDKTNHFDKAEELIKEILEAEPDNARALNYLGYSYVNKNINLDVAEQLLEKLIKTGTEEPAYLDSFAWLYYKKQNYELAETYILKAVNNQNSVFDKDLYEHLGDISIETDKIQQAYFAYSVAYDLGSVTAKKKMNLLKNKIPKNDIAKIIARRAVFNYTRISTLKAGYKLKLHYAGGETSSFMSALYVKNAGVKFDIAPKFSFPGFSVIFKDDETEFSPNAVRESLNSEIILMFDFANIVLSKEFVNILIDAKTSFKGKNIIYENDNITVKINSKTGQFKNFLKKDLFNLEINSYKNFNKVSKIPDKMIFKMKKNKFKAAIQNTKLTIPEINEVKNFIEDIK